MAALVKGSPAKSTWLPKAALSAPDPVRIPRLPTPSGGVDSWLPSLKLGPDRRSESPLPITFRSTTLQVGPKAVGLRSLGPMVPSLILLEVTEPFAILGAVTEPSFSRPLPIVSSCSRLALTLASLMSAPVKEPSFTSAPVMRVAPTAPPPTPMTSATAARTIVGLFIRAMFMGPPKSRPPTPCRVVSITVGLVGTA